MAESEYTRLTPMRKRAGFAIFTVSRSGLWLGADHLLCVESEGYNETYKRFYFRDIQAIVLRRTHRMLGIAIATGLITGLFVLIALTAPPAEVKWTFGVLAGVAAIPFVVNLAYGPTCQCQLRTAVQTEEMPSMGRVRRARKAMERIRPLIAEAQGTVRPEELTERIQQLENPESAPAAGTTPLAPELPSETAPPFPPTGQSPTA